MSDEIDATADRMDSELALTLQGVHIQAASIPKGEPGDCFYCGEFFSRVVGVVDKATDEEVKSCGHCRDARGLP